MKYFMVPLLGMLLVSYTMNAQSYELVTAQSGDGILSILRDQGMNPSKYYAEFVALNEDNLINASELHAGRQYRLPHAPDSFKNMGRLIKVSDTLESSIFENRLSELTLKSSDLKNAVYYLIPEREENSMVSKGDDLIDDVTLNLAKRLLENGARVYILGADQSIGEESGMKVTEAYVTEINKRYIRHSGKYQRLLLVRANGSTTQRNVDVLVSYHIKSQEGQKFAQNLQNAFRSGARKKTAEGKMKVFQDKRHLFLAKNILPAVTVIELGESDNKEQMISIPKNEDALVRYLTKGIFSDYADLNFED